jgi:hypothetical protein
MMIAAAIQPTMTGINLDHFSPFAFVPGRILHNADPRLGRRSNKERSGPRTSSANRALAASAIARMASIPSAARLTRNASWGCYTAPIQAAVARRKEPKCVILFALSSQQAPPFLRGARLQRPRIA